MKTSDLRDWLAPQLPAGLTIVIGPRIPSMPDDMVILTRTSGPGLSVENVLDTVGFQVRVRGNQNRPDSVETLADVVDRVFVDADYPLTIGGTHVTVIQRSGGAPAAMPYAPDGDRSNWTCNYLITYAR